MLLSCVNLVRLGGQVTSIVRHFCGQRHMVTSRQKPSRIPGLYSTVSSKQGSSSVTESRGSSSITPCLELGRWSPPTRSLRVASQFHLGQALERGLRLCPGEPGNDGTGGRKSGRWVAVKDPRCTVASRYLGQNHLGQSCQ